MIEYLINKLMVFKDFSVEGNIGKFEEILGELASQKNPDIIYKLLPFFDDDTDFPEVMFSIIHTIEIFDDAQYIKNLLLSIPEAWKKSPYWVKVLQFRIFNSKSTFEEYLKQINELDGNQKLVIKNIASLIKTESPKFIEKCDLVLDLLDRQ